ncbi:20446_t:CDS:1, partial [Racocetra persica]
YRHKGYASKLVELLSDKFKIEYKAKFSYLYSEIGPNFYPRLGWKIFSHKEIRFNVDNKYLTPLENSESIIAINNSNLEYVVNKDCELIKNDLGKLNKKSVAILPTKPAFYWLFQKTKLYSNFLTDDNDSKLFGAIIMNEKNNSISKNFNENFNDELLENFIMWNHDFKDNKLFIIRFRSDSPYKT